MNSNWWENTVFYQIYMPSFRDGNNDGIGDFKGITEKLDYLKELGIRGLWLTPFYESPKVDNGYDISNYEKIDSQYGDQSDFEHFLKEAKKRQIKVIADLVINHTSTEHSWFKESSSAVNSIKREWYIWKDKPNNWESFFGGSAWEYDEKTDQYYYHSFAKEQADLNWGNPELRSQIYKMIDFWLDKGVDGFRLDVINNLTIHDRFEQNPTDENGEQIHCYDKDQEGIEEILKELIQHIKKENPQAITVGEISSDELPVLSHYAQNGLFDLTFNFNLGSMKNLNVENLFDELVNMNEMYLGERLPTLFFGSHDLDRSWNRLADQNKDKYKVLITFLLTAKGVPFIYFGEEIGMESFVPQSLKDFRDIQGINAYRHSKEQGKSEEEALAIAQQKTRDSGRSPMQWEDEEGKKEYWIPGNPNRNPDKIELFDYYKRLIELRTELNLKTTDYDQLKRHNQLIFYKRGKVMVYLNFGFKEEQVSFEWKNVSVLSKTGLIDIEDQSIKLRGFSAVIIEVNEGEHS